MHVSIWIDKFDYVRCDVCIESPHDKPTLKWCAVQVSMYIECVRIIFVHSSTYSFKATRKSAAAHTTNAARGHLSSASLTSAQNEVMSLKCKQR